MGNACRTDTRCETSSSNDAAVYPVAVFANDLSGSKCVWFAWHDVNVDQISVQPYSEVYGLHPRRFDFDKDGNMIHCQDAFVWRHLDAETKTSMVLEALTEDEEMPTVQDIGPAFGGSLPPQTRCRRYKTTLSKLVTMKEKKRKKKSAVEVNNNASFEQFEQPM